MKTRGKRSKGTREFEHKEQAVRKELESFKKKEQTARNQQGMSKETGKFETKGKPLERN